MSKYGTHRESISLRYFFLIFKKFAAGIVFVSSLQLLSLSNSSTLKLVMRHTRSGVKNLLRAPRRLYLPPREGSTCVRHLISPPESGTHCEQSASGDGGGEGPSMEHTTECDTLVGRLVGLLLDRDNPGVPDLHEVRITRLDRTGAGPSPPTPDPHAKCTWILE